MINPVRDFAWGSSTAFSEYFGWTPSATPQAELWMGTHAAAPSHAVIDSDDGENRMELGTLLKLLPQLLTAAHSEHDATSEPSEAESGALPFLLKVLAVEQPLSIQTHPCSEEAQAGYLRENTAGVALDAPERNYKDPHHKPELLVALTDFSALCGFRTPEAAIAVLEQVASLLPEGQRTELKSLQKLVASGDFTQALEFILRTHIRQCAQTAEALASVLKESGLDASELVEPQLMDTMQRITEAFPGDPGLLVALLLNREELSAGQGIFLPAGRMHCYLSGMGVEIMAASDNVLRGGLTTKHVDVDELLAITDPRPLSRSLCEPQYEAATGGAPTITRFQPPVDEFQLLCVDFSQETGAYEWQDSSCAVVLCTAGTVDTDAGALTPGESVFLGAGERARFRAEGPAQIFVATTGQGVGHA